MAGLERDQDVGIHGSDGRRIAIGHVDGAVRKPDVVDDAGYFRFRNRFADGGFNQVPQARGFFDARARLGAKMQIKLAGVGGGEKVATEPGKQKKGGGAQREKGRNEESPRGGYRFRACRDNSCAWLQNRARKLVGNGPRGSRVSALRLCWCGLNKYMARVGTRVRDKR